MSGILTGAQKRVFDFYLEYGKANQHYPSLREVCEALEFSSTNSVRSHLKALEKKGFIKKEKYGSIELTGYQFVLTQQGKPIMMEVNYAR